MSDAEIVLDHDVATVLRVVEERTVAFLRNELGMVADRIERRLHHEQTVVLRPMTAIVGVGSMAGLYIAYSYDTLLIREMTKRYTKELTIGPDDEALYMRETASDIVNVIVGNCTAELARNRGVVTLSPPVLMLGARTIQGRPKTAISALTLHFREGLLDVAFVGPRRLFDINLNYKGGIA